MNCGRAFWRSVVAAGAGVGYATSESLPDAWFQCQTYDPSEAAEMTVAANLERALASLRRR